VSENRVLGRIFGSKLERLGKLHNEKMHCVYSSPNFIDTIKSRSMRLAGYIAGTGDI
jgi:hypothetical protein